MAQPNFIGGQFTLGPNCSIAIYVGGTELDIGLENLIRFEARPEITKNKVSLMKGYTFALPFLHGWEGMMEIQRANNKLDLIWYNTFVVPVQAGLGYPSVNIIQTIKETDRQTVTRINYQGAVLYWDEAGTFENENGVVQKLSFAAPLGVVTAN